MNVFQSALRASPAAPRAPFFGVLRGVVLTVTFADDPAQADRLTRQLLCDVLTRYGVLRRVPVLQQGASVTNGALWVPQPCRANLDGGPLTWRASEDLPSPAHLDALDGERVLLQFIDGDPASPVILGALPHPRGLRPQNGEGPLPDPSATETLDPTPAGNERWVSHQGTTARLDRAGNLRLDTTAAGTANDGATQEPEAAGHLDINLNPTAELVIRLAGEPVLRLRQVEGHLHIDLGPNATERMVLGDTFARLFDAHQHLTWYGSTGPVAPAWTTATAQAGEGKILSEIGRVR